MSKTSKGKIYLLTEERYLNPKVKNDYNDNILLEEGILSEALLKEGINSERVIWSDPKINWSNADYLLFRTTWDYFDRFNEFENWLNQIEKTVPTINCIKTVKWNLDKKYLLELEKKGIDIPQSILLPINNEVNLLEQLNQKKWKKGIVKPCISSTARDTYVIDRNNAEQMTRPINDLLKKEDFLFQKFEEKVLTEGELSMMFFGGKYTHTVLKKAKEGDFRVQDDFGGTVHEYEAGKKEIAFGQKVIEAMNVIPDYARVDILWNDEGELVLSELELIEPELWFRFNPDSAMILARHLKHKYF